MSDQACGVTTLISFITSGIHSRGRKQPLIPANVITIKFEYDET